MDISGPEKPPNPLHRRDGYAEVVADEDGMTVECTLFPPVEDGEILSVDYLEQLLSQKGIIEGVLWEEIGEAVFRCNTEHKIIEHLVLARGSRPVEEIPAHIVLKTRLVRKKTPAEAEEEGKTDYKKFRAYTIVRKGEVIGKEEPLQVGRPGRSVFGKELSYGKKTIPQLIPGLNVRADKGLIYSGKDGHFILQGQVFSVEETLEIKGDVDYSVGHVEYPGDVIIHGEIRDGFRVAAAGSVTCISTVDASEIMCKKDFHAKLGVIGRGKGIVRAGGKVEAKFFENCTVEALGPVTVSGGFFHCLVFTQGTLDLGEKGRFVGGTARCKGGFRCGGLGNEAGTPTEVFGGLDFVMERRYDYAKEKHQTMVLTLQNVEQVLKTKPTEKLVETREKLKKGVLELQHFIDELFPHVQANDEASITVHGRVYPGVTIHLGGISFDIKEEKTQVRFVFDRTARIIREESLKKS
jgi:hypothetical protein